MAAIKRIAFKSTKAATRCLNCKGKLVNAAFNYEDGENYDCPVCGLKHTVRISRDKSRVIITDYKKRYLFESENM